RDAAAFPAGRTTERHERAERLSGKEPEAGEPARRHEQRLRRGRAMRMKPEQSFHDAETVLIRRRPAIEVNRGERTLEIPFDSPIEHPRERPIVRQAAFRARPAIRERAPIRAPMRAPRPRVNTIEVALFGNTPNGAQRALRCAIYLL